MNGAPEDWFAKYMQSQDELSTARGVLAFIHGVLETTSKYNREVTPGLVDAMIKEASSVLNKKIGAA
jgi:hypothetical protein